MNDLPNPVEIARMLEGYFGIEVPPAITSMTITLDFETPTTKVEVSYSPVKPTNGDSEK